MRLEVAGPILKREAGQGSGAQDWGQEDFNRERVLEMPERSVRKTSPTSCGAGVAELAWLHLQEPRQPSCTSLHPGRPLL